MSRNLLSASLRAFSVSRPRNSAVTCRAMSTRMTATRAISSSSVADMVYSAEDRLPVYALTYQALRRLPDATRTERFSTRRRLMQIERCRQRRRRRDSRASSTRAVHDEADPPRHVMEHIHDYLIIGAGMAAGAAAKAIREVDAAASIGIVGAEAQPPYQRPPLSKALWKGDKSLDDIDLGTS